MSGRLFCTPISALTPENGKVSFTLVDLDNDGKRDLIIDSYIGGTGLFSYGVAEAGDNTFDTVDNSDTDDDDDFDAGVPGALFSLNGRGANQWNQWVRINGGVCAVVQQPVRRGQPVSLRPFQPDGQKPCRDDHAIATGWRR